MAKKSRNQPQISPALRLSGLGPRVARLIALDMSDAGAVQAELARLTAGLKPTSFLPILVNTCAAASDEQRAGLKPIVGTWLRDNGLVEPLRKLEANYVFDAAGRQVAREWLEMAGQSLEPLVNPAPEDLVISAYQVGGRTGDSQASLTLLWYEDARQRRVHLASFLIDYEPPWEGAVKDLAYSNHRDAEIATRKFMSIWEEESIAIHQIGLSSFMRQIWTALRQNVAQNISLPDDFIAAFGIVMTMLLSLPAHPDAPALNQHELKALITGKLKPEQLRELEQRFGYQKRMPDGSIIHILPPLGKEL